MSATSPGSATFGIEPIRQSTKHRPVKDELWLNSVSIDEIGRCKTQSDRSLETAPYSDLRVEARTIHDQKTDYCQWLKTSRPNLDSNQVLLSCIANTRRTIHGCDPFAIRSVFWGRGNLDSCDSLVRLGIQTGGGECCFAGVCKSGFEPLIPSHQEPLHSGN